MRRKKYFWNLPHHRELDIKMGLAKRMAEPFAQLAEDCEIDTNIGYTRGLYPFPIISTRHGDIKNTKPYDIVSKDAKTSFPINSPN